MDSNLLKQFKPDQIPLIEKAIQEEESFSKEILLSLFEPPRESPLKSIEQQERETAETIKTILEAKNKDIEDGVRLFIKECQENERPTLEKIFNKMTSALNQITGDGEVSSISEEDCEFLA